MSKEEKKVLVAAEAASLPSFLGEMVTDADENNGFEDMDATRDCAIPFIGLLQAISPKCKGATKLKGAEEGMFINTVTDEIYGVMIKVVPCAFKHAVVEWKPNRGGFVAQHDNPIEAESLIKECVKGPKGENVLPNGNVLVDTAYHFVLVVRPNGSYERAIIALTQTQLKKSRLWNSQMKSQQIEVSKGVFKRPSMYACMYTCTAIDEANKLGTWKSWRITEPKLITNVDLYRSAKFFHDEVTKGLVKAVPPQTEDEEIVKDVAESTTVM